MYSAATQSNFSCQTPRAAAARRWTADRRPVPAVLCSKSMCVRNYVSQRFVRVVVASVSFLLNWNEMGGLVTHTVCWKRHTEAVRTLNQWPSKWRVYKPDGPQNTKAAVTTAAVTPAAIKIFSPSMVCVCLRGFALQQNHNQSTSITLALVLVPNSTRTNPFQNDRRWIDALSGRLH